MAYEMQYIPREEPVRRPKWDTEEMVTVTMPRGMMVALNLAASAGYDHLSNLGKGRVREAQTIITAALHPKD